MNEKTAFITGTSTGIGAATAELLCSKGWKVYGTVRKISDAKDLTSKYNDRFEAVVYDVRDVESLPALTEKIMLDLGDKGLDLLVNNAGIAVAGPLEEISNDDFEMQLDVNVKAVFRITNAFIPALIKNGHSNIINIGSISGLFTSPFLGAYSISKFVGAKLVFPAELTISFIPYSNLRPKIPLKAPSLPMRLTPNPRTAP